MPAFFAAAHLHARGVSSILGPGYAPGVTFYLVDAKTTTGTITPSRIIVDMVTRKMVRAAACDRQRASILRGTLLPKQ